jgi:hypothetical protein
MDLGQVRKQYHQISLEILQLVPKTRYIISLGNNANQGVPKILSKTLLWKPATSSNLKPKYLSLMTKYKKNAR